MAGSLMSGLRGAAEAVAGKIGLETQAQRDKKERVAKSREALPVLTSTITAIKDGRFTVQNYSLGEVQNIIDATQAITYSIQKDGLDISSLEEDFATIIEESRKLEEDLLKIQKVMARAKEIHQELYRQDGQPRYAQITERSTMKQDMQILDTVLKLKPAPKGIDIGFLTATKAKVETTIQQEEAKLKK